MMNIQQSPIADKNRPLRQRVTPTFIHHNIFASTDSNLPTNVRYTPTYASTVFDCEGYSKQTLHSRPQKPTTPQTTNRSQPFVIVNQAKERKQAELYPCCIYFTDKNFEAGKDEKDKALEEINSLGGKTSRMRKIVEQISNPIFGSGYFWRPIVSVDPQLDRPYSPEAYARSKPAQSLDKEDYAQVKGQMQQAQIKRQQGNTKTKEKKVAEEKFTRKKEQGKGKQSTTAIRQKNLTRFKSASNLASKSLKPAVKR